MKSHVNPGMDSARTNVVSNAQDVMAAIEPQGLPVNKVPTKDRDLLVPTDRMSDKVVHAAYFRRPSDRGNAAVVHRPTFGGTDRKQEQWPSTDWTNPWTPK